MSKLASLLCIATCLCAVGVRADDTDMDGFDDAEEFGDTDGDGIDDWQDPDDDNDGVLTATEVQRAPAGGDSDGDGSFDWLDADDDNDRLPTMSELGPGGGSAPRNTDGDALFDYLDDDDDGDGEPTVTERQSAPPEPDVNQNQIPDYLDPAAFGSQAGALPVPDSTCRSTQLDDAGLPVCWELDHDGDGIWSSFEGAPNFSQDTDGDGIPDFRDSDDDGDGVPTKDEEPDPNHDGNTEDARNTSGNNVDYLNPDDDDDQVPTQAERPADKDQDTDLDGRPNHLDEDDDGDRYDTRTENSGPDGEKTDGNKNGIPAYLDPDEHYMPPTDTTVADGGAPTPIASLDAGTAQLSDAGTSARRDAAADASRDATSGASSGEEEQEEEDAGDDWNPEDEPLKGGKSSGCSLAVVRHDATMLSVLSGLALAALLARRRALARAHRLR